MKRSEMIKRIKEGCDNWLGQKLSRNDIEWILSVAERAGMLPPQIDGEFWNRAENDFHKVNEWEPEDE